MSQASERPMQLTDVGVDGPIAGGGKGSYLDVDVGS